MSATLVAALKWIVAVPALPLLVLRAIQVRLRSISRRDRAAKPRLVYGPTPIISIKYMSRAMRLLGYQADTAVNEIYPINRREDFDFLLDDFVPDLSWAGPFHTLARRALRPYASLLRLLPDYDIYNFFFDGGFLAGTPLRFLEVQILHLAGKKVVVMPYGSDAAITRHTRSLPWRQGMLSNYPRLGRIQDEISRAVRYFSRTADFVVACIIHGETLPRWDLLTTHYYPIDLAEWSPPAEETFSGGPNRAIRIVHAPNHRGLKGTEFLLRACDELRAEGLNLELRLLERLPNHEVRRSMQDADIVAEQFILGYALTAMEGMSLGKPVLSNLEDDHYYGVHRLYTGLDECPIVSTSPDTLKEKLRWLVTDAEARARLGREGRRYVEKFHSYASVGRMWDHVYRKVWGREDLNVSVWPPRTPEESRIG